MNSKIAPGQPLTKKDTLERLPLIVRPRRDVATNVGWGTRADELVDDLGPSVAVDGKVSEPTSPPQRNIRRAPDSPGLPRDELLFRSVSETAYHSTPLAGTR